MMNARDIVLNTREIEQGIYGTAKLEDMLSKKQTRIAPIKNFLQNFFDPDTVDLNKYSKEDNVFGNIILMDGDVASTVIGTNYNDVMLPMLRLIDDDIARRMELTMNHEVGNVFSGLIGMLQLSGYPDEFKWINEFYTFIEASLSVPKENILTQSNTPIEYNGKDISIITKKDISSIIDKIPQTDDHIHVINEQGVAHVLVDLKNSKLAQYKDDFTSHMGIQISRHYEKQLNGVIEYFESLFKPESEQLRKEFYDILKNKLFKCGMSTEEMKTIETYERKLSHYVKDEERDTKPKRGIRLPQVLYGLYKLRVIGEKLSDKLRYSPTNEHHESPSMDIYSPAKR